MTSRHIALVAVVFAALVWACGKPSATPTCYPTNCTGCCDSSGACREGTSQDACGTGGEACAACSDGSCAEGRCGPVAPAFLTGAEGATAFDTGCQTAREALCDFMVRCHRFTTKTGCLSEVAFGSACSDEWRRAIADSRAEVSPHELSSCASAYAASTCAVTNGFDLCTSAIRGRIPGGGTCFTDLDCVQGAYCLSGSTCPGICALKKAIGDSVAPGERCVDGADGYDGKCRALVARGASCAPISPSTTDQRCTAGNYCNPGKICAERLGENSPCTSFLQCQTFLSCAGGSCQPDRGQDAGCTFAGTAEPTCSRDLYCDSDGGTPTSIGTCKALVGQGGSCWNLLACDRSLYCAGASPGTRGTCTTRLSRGASCTDTTQCADGLYCNGTSCQTQKGPGQACSLPTECLLGFSCTNGQCVQSYCFDVTP